MNPALAKTLTFALLILAGYLLQKKIQGKQDLSGLKVLILSVILPATIFVALLKVEISIGMILLPIGALALNGVLYYVSREALPKLGFERGSKEWRTMSLLMPSLAPGLSVFPFILEYLGEESLALAALADVGNKVFVLIVLYLIAMQWYYRSRPRVADTVDRSGKLRALGLSLLREPVNLVMVAALLMLAFGLNLTNLPLFVESTVSRLAALMTPIVLLFIGMAVRFRRQEMALILRALCFRSGLAFLLSAVTVYLAGLTGAGALLAVVFAQCAVSFWPFAHMAAVEAMRKEGEAPVFELDLGLNVLAFSLPFSTVVILSVLTFGDTFASPGFGLLAAATMALVPLVYVLRPLLQSGEVEKVGA